MCSCLALGAVAQHKGKKSSCHGSSVTIIALSLARILGCFFCFFFFGSVHRLTCVRKALAHLYYCRLSTRNYSRGFLAVVTHRGSSGAARLPVADHLQRIFEVFSLVRFSIRDATRERMSGPRSVFDECAQATHTVVEYFSKLSHGLWWHDKGTPSEERFSRVLLQRSVLVRSASDPFPAHRPTLPHEEHGSC